MSIKRLSAPVTSRPTRLFWDADRGDAPLEIEVPAGESAFCIAMSNELEPVRFVFHLRHPDSRLSLRALVNAAGESAPKLQTSVIHHAPRTQAETLVRTLAYDAASPSFEGLIRIEPAAQGAESYLDHHSLLLGSKARSRTIPSLEIEADQVRCSHAATLRTITDLDLFYLRSRGLSPTEARSLLIEAFLADVSDCLA